MQLWQVIQWGNIIEGGNGPDTQCIVSAANMEDAISLGKERICDHNRFSKNDWEDDLDMVFLLGEDQRPDGEPILIVQVWVAHAFNLANSPSWHRASNGNWVTHAEMFLDVNGK